MKKKLIYQNIVIPGVDIPLHYSNNEGSAFWNEGKFNNYIKPYLPIDCSDQTFAEMGTNAGLFLRLATEMGFRNAIGIEKDKTPVKWGIRHRDSLGHEYTLLRRTLGVNFDIDEFPVVDFTIMSTFHYYIDIDTWVKYLDRLKTKTRYCIIVSRNTGRKRWMAMGGLQHVRRNFKDWCEVNYISQVPMEGDPSPRELWSLCFKSELQRISISDISVSHYRQKMTFVKEVIAGVKDTRSTWYYKWMLDRNKRRSRPWSEQYTENFIATKIKMVQSVLKNGFRDPLILQQNNKLSDGGHRIAIATVLGYKSVIVRYI